MKLLALLFVPLLAMGSFPKSAPKPSAPKVPSRELTVRERWWRDAEPLPEAVFRIDKAVELYRTTAHRYRKVELMRKTGVPAPVIFVFHMRESTWSFSKHLHEGSSLQGRTRWVPKGRPKKGSPPFTWEESAEDALYTLKDYEGGNGYRWKTIDSMLDWIEQYNGLGYRKYRPQTPSPYVVAGSTEQRPGKYVADGKFSQTAVDKQLGCLIVLKAIAKRGYWDPPPY